MTHRQEEFSARDSVYGYDWLCVTIAKNNKLVINEMRKDENCAFFSGDFF